jgi:hypothetical protein
MIKLTQAGWQQRFLYPKEGSGLFSTPVGWGFDLVRSYQQYPQPKPAATLAHLT